MTSRPSRARRSESKAGRQARRRQGGQQQVRLARVGRCHWPGDDRPGGLDAGLVGRHQHDRGRRDGEGRPGAQGGGCGIPGAHLDRQPHQPVEPPQAQQCHQHHAEARPEAEVPGGHRQEARDLRAVPIQIDRPAEQRGRGDVEVAAQHQQEVAQGEPADQPARRGSGAPRHEQQDDPQGDELGCEPGVGHHGRGGPEVVEAQCGVQEQQRQRDLQPLHAAPVSPEPDARAGSPTARPGAQRGAGSGPECRPKPRVSRMSR